MTRLKAPHIDAPADRYYVCLRDEDLWQGVEVLAACPVGAAEIAHHYFPKMDIVELQSYPY